MSDNWITLIPKNPQFVPSELNRIRALRRFQEIAPQAETIEIKLSETPAFFDCGSNLDSIVCPACSAEIDREWWGARMGDDFMGQGFRLAIYATPCCNSQCTLDTLIYDWPQGFSRYGLEAMNPVLGKLPDDLRTEFESILGTSLRVIYQHI